jgi:hypothetical protein
MKHMLFIFMMWIGSVYTTPVRILSPSNFNQGNSFTITQTGLYMLSDDVVSTAANTLVISSSNVEVDLNGKSLLGQGAGATAGISVSPGIGNIKIRNGTIANYQTNGIVLAAGTARSNILVEGVNIISTGTGIALNNCFNVEIRKCKIALGSSVGISMTNAVNIFVDQCSVRRNSLSGCTIATSTAYISNCTMSENGGQGVFMGIGASGVISDSTFSANSNAGVSIASGAIQVTVSRCIANFSTANAGFTNDSTTGAVIGCIAFMNTTTNYSTAASAVSAISVNRASQLAAGAVTDVRYDNLAIT